MDSSGHASGVVIFVATDCLTNEIDYEHSDPRIETGNRPFTFSFTTEDPDVCTTFCLCGLPNAEGPPAISGYPYPFRPLFTVNYNECNCTKILLRNNPFTEWLKANRVSILSSYPDGSLVLPLTAANISLLQTYGNIRDEGHGSSFALTTGEGYVLHPYRLIPDGSNETIYSNVSCYANATVG